MDNIEKRLKINELLRIYGAMLTPRQREILMHRYYDDCSFGELAIEFNISRQAVLNFEIKAVRALMKYEKKLGVYAREQKIKELFERTFVDPHARSALYEVFA